jgi:hypothetical protein
MRLRCDPRHYGVVVAWKMSGETTIQRRLGDFPQQRRPEHDNGPQIGGDVMTGAKDMRQFSCSDHESPCPRAFHI